MSDHPLEYQRAPAPKRPRTRWWLILVLLAVTPLVLFLIVLLLTFLGCFGGPGD